MTRRLCKNGNMYETTKSQDKDCYDVTFYNCQGFVVAKNPCLTKKELTDLQESLDSTGWKKR